MGGIISGSEIMPEDWDSLEAGKIIELVFFPLNVTLYGSLLLVAFLGWRFRDLTTCIFSFLACGIALLTQRDRIEEENELYMWSAVGTLPTFVLLTVLLEPSPEIIFGGTSILATLVVGFFIRSNWHISAHVSAATSVLTILLFIDWIFLPFGLIVPIVIWSRIDSGAHTKTQAAAGLPLGFAIPALTYILMEAPLGLPL